jgi:hypothetical protein
MTLSYGSNLAQAFDVIANAYRVSQRQVYKMKDNLEIFGSVAPDPAQFQSTSSSSSTSGLGVFSIVGRDICVSGISISGRAGVGEGRSSSRGIFLGPCSVEGGGIESRTTWVSFSGVGKAARALDASIKACAASRTSCVSRRPAALLRGARGREEPLGAVRGVGRCSDELFSRTFCVGRRFRTGGMISINNIQTTPPKFG